MFTSVDATLFWLSASIVPALTSVVYFRSSPSDEPLAQRLVVSAHGAVISTLCVAAMAVGILGSPSQGYGKLFGLLLWTPIILITYSFWQFRGNKLVHMLQAINLIWLLAATIFGGMAITGIWL